jgi:hypothetical protein
MTQSYEPAHWFWIVAGDESRVWSSEDASYVQPSSNQTGRISRIASESELREVLSAYGLRGPVGKSELAAYAADKRWRIVSAGIAVGGLQVPGDDVAQTRLNLARDRLKSGELTEPLTYTIGLINVPLTLAMLDAIVPALAQMTQAAFAVQGSLVTAINAGTVTTYEQIDAAAWPT